jgi:hypothetical protein
MAPIRTSWMPVNVRFELCMIGARQIVAAKQTFFEAKAMLVVPITSDRESLRGIRFAFCIENEHLVRAPPMAQLLPLAIGLVAWWLRIDPDRQLERIRRCACCQ